MNRMYCMSCGAKHEYQTHKPSKCGRCFANMSQTIISDCKDKHIVRYDDYNDEDAFGSHLIDAVDIEPITNAELQSIFLNSNKKCIKLGDIMLNNVSEKPTRNRKKRKSS